MAGNNFFGGGIGGTVTPRRRGGSIRWHGGLGAGNSESPPALDGSAFIAGVGTVLSAYAAVWTVSRTIPKAKNAVDRIMKRKKQSIVTKVPEATIKGTEAIIKEVMN